MPVAKRDSTFWQTDEGLDIHHQLEQMVLDDRYNTASSYSTNGNVYADNLIPFVDKHMNYLRTHPSLDPQHYMANLRLITRLRGPVAAS